MIQEIRAREEIDIFFLGTINNEERADFVKRFPARVNIFSSSDFPRQPSGVPLDDVWSFNGANRVFRQEYHDCFNSFIQSRQYEYRWALFEYLETGYLRTVLADSVGTLCDLHDLISFRSLSFRGVGKESFSINAETERLLMRGFDCIIAIQENEAKVLWKWGFRNVLLVPYSPTYHIHDAHNALRNVGIDARKRLMFVGSNGEHNQHAIDWFLRFVFPYIGNRITLHVYGAIGNYIRRNNFDTKRIILRGWVDQISEAYAEAGIAVNPAVSGSGLKIKTVDAMAHKIPLVTTPYGAEGMERYAKRGLLVVETAKAMAGAINLLSRNEEFYEKIMKDHVFPFTDLPGDPHSSLMGLLRKSKRI